MNSESSTSDISDHPAVEARRGPVEFDVMHLTSAHDTRDNRIFQRECVTLAENGYRVGFIAPHDRNEEASGVRILAVPRPRRRSVRLTVTPLAVLRQALRHKASVYHFHDPELLPAGLLLRLLKRKVIYDAHEDHPNSMLYSPSLPQPLRRAFSRTFRALERFSAGRWSAVIAANDEIARHLAELECRPVTVGNFPDLSQFPIPSLELSRYSSGVIANFGGVEARTCSIPIVKALALLPESLKPRMLLGGKSHSPALQEEVQRLAGWSRVEYRGALQREAMIEALLGASVAMVLYRREPNNYGIGSNRFYEALAAGLPVVASDFPNWRAMIERFDCGMVADPEDPQSIADALEYLLAHPNEARRMGQNSRRAALHHCNWVKERTKLLQIYDQVLTEPSVDDMAADSAASPQRRGQEPANELRLLRPEDFPEWDALVESSPQGSIFCRSWWLQAVGEGVRVLGYFEGGQLIAGMPLYYKKRHGLTLCTMPRLTQTWGLVLRPLPGRVVSTGSHEMRIAKIFSQHLAREKFFLQLFHPHFQNWLPFLWGGFKQTLGCTYLLDDLSDCDAVWQGMDHNVRTKIRKAQREGLTVAPCGIDVVFDCVRKSFDRQQKVEPYSREYLTSLYDAARRNDAGECFACVDRSDKIHAASFLVWDSKAAHYLAGGADPQLRNSGAQTLVAWHCIQFAAEHSKSFDFCGSVLEPIEQFVRSFGAQQVPYSQISKMPKVLSLLRASAV